MEQVPLDAKLLGNAVIELNIARHILALYPPEHQLVQLSLDKTFAILTDLFDLRSEITLAVAKDTLIVDERHLDPKNPVFREFALALSRISVALVSFVKGLTREEVFGFFRFLSREAAGLSSETLPAVLTEYELRHVLVEPLDYRTFVFAEDLVHTEDAEQHLLERHLKGLLDGELAADRVQQAIESVGPATLAAIVNQSGHASAREETYDTVVSTYLRAGAARRLTGENLQKLMTFVAQLRPELKRQFLASSVKAFASDTAALGQALEEVPMDSVLAFFGEVDRGGLALPESLNALIAEFARTGIELPGGGLNLDDVLLSREVSGLFKEPEDAAHTPADYRAELRQLLESPVPGAAEATGWVPGHEMDEDYIRYCHANALLALLESPLPELISLEDEEIHVRSFAALAERAVGTGEYGQLLELLTRVEELGRRGRHAALFDAVRAFSHGPQFLTAVAESFRRHGRANRTAAALVCAHYGAAIVPALFDLLAVEERLHLRRMLLHLLSGLSADALPEIARRLEDPRWHVRRNALYLVAETGAPCDARLLERLSRDPDPRVRLECARCLIRSGAPAGLATLRSLLREGAAGAADAAAALAGALEARELIPELIQLARQSSGPAGVRTRHRVVRALRQIGSDEAAEALRSLLKLRLLLPGERKRFRSEVERALLRLELRRADSSPAAKGEVT